MIERYTSNKIYLDDLEKHTTRYQNNILLFGPAESLGSARRVNSNIIVDTNVEVALL